MQLLSGGTLAADIVPRVIGSVCPDDIKRMPPGEYVIVQFDAARDKFDPQTVSISLNERELRCARGCPVILPAAYITLVDTCVMDGDDRSDDTDRRRFPYTVLGKATHQQFMDMLNQGNEETKKAIQDMRDRQPDEEELAIDRIRRLGALEATQRYARGEFE